MNRKRPELLSPAGTLNAMRHAFAYGADAVYAGQPRYSLRTRNNEFKKDILETGIEEAHSQGKKFYVAVNLFPHNAKLKTFMTDMEFVIAMKPDGLIMADPGLIMLVRDRWPEMPVHLSVQMNTVNYQSVRFWQRQGIKRIILSRELSLDEMAEIRQQCPEIELEVFVHGALCIAYSGRCLLSGYFNHRDANQGVCTNACRWNYKTCASEEGAGGDVLPAGALDASCAGGGERHPLAERVYFLEEKERPNELMPVFEDEHGTYIMNSKDLRAIEYVERLVDIGIDCLKIEGRTKSHYYVARTAQAYRRAIDLAVGGQSFDKKLMDDLAGLANRGYTTGFYDRHRADETQNYLTGGSRSHRQEFVGEVLECCGDGWALVDVKNNFKVGDRIEFILPKGDNIEIVLTAMQDEAGKAITVAPGNGHKVLIPYTGEKITPILIARFIEI